MSRRLLVVLLVVALIVAGSALAVIVTREQPAPTPSPSVVTVDPLTLPSTPRVELKSRDEAPGNVPNGATPSDTETPDGVQVVADGLGGNVRFVDTPTRNPWTPAQAVAYAAGEVVHPDKNYYNLCAHFVSWVYGYAGYGYYSAKAGGLATSRSIRHSAANPDTIPAGAIVYFVGPDTGAYGHVVISNGDGRVYSNDISVKGEISLVPLSIFEQRWGMSPSFWTPPVFPNAFGRNPNPAPKVVAPLPPRIGYGPYVYACSVNRRARVRAVLYVRSALGMAAVKPCGPQVRKRTARYQKANGWASSGLLTKRQLVILGKRSKVFRVR